MWLFPSCYFHPLEQRPAFHSCWRSKLGFLPYSHCQSIPGGLPVFLFPEDSGHICLKPTKDFNGLSPVIVSVPMFSFQTVPILKINLPQSYSSKCMFVGTLTFLEKELFLCIFSFPQRTAVNFPWSRPVLDLSFCTFSLNDLASSSAPGWDTSSPYHTFPPGSVSLLSFALTLNSTWPK